MVSPLTTITHHPRETALKHAPRVQSEGDRWNPRSAGSWSQRTPGRWWSFQISRCSGMRPEGEGLLRRRPGGMVAALGVACGVGGLVVGRAALLVTSRLGRAGPVRFCGTTGRAVMHRVLVVVVVAA